jgi:hypothetical protein
MSATKSSRKKKTAPHKATVKRTAKTSKTASSSNSNGPGATPNSGKKSSKKSKAQSGQQSEGLAAEAIRIVEQAASILEEEISAGIVAAKKVEQRYVNVNALRSGDSEQVIQRFRKDAHEVLDILLDLVNLSINAIGGMSARAINLRSSTDAKNKPNAKPEENLTEIVVTEALKPGDSGKVGMLVENESDTPTGQFTFTTAGLLSSNGDQLDPTAISFEPATLEIAANDLEKMTIHVVIPAGTPAGQYSGLLSAPTVQMRAILTVNVVA